MFDKNEREEIQEQIDQMVELLVTSGQRLYTRLAEERGLHKAMAKCTRAMVEELQAEGFSREEAIAIATHFFNKIGSQK